MIPPLAVGRSVVIKRYEDALPQWDNKRIVREIVKLQAQVRRLQEKAKKK